METKKEYINRIFLTARMRGLCKKQSEFAALLAMNPSTISKALQGDEKYLSDNLVRRIKLWSQQQGFEDGQVAKPVQPDITIPAATAALYNNMSETIRIQAEIIARLQGGLTAPRGGAYAPPKNWTTDKP